MPWLAAIHYRPRDDTALSAMRKHQADAALAELAGADADLREAERIDQAGKSSAESTRQRGRPGARWPCQQPGATLRHNKQHTDT